VAGDHGPDGLTADLRTLGRTAAPVAEAEVSALVAGVTARLAAERAASPALTGRPAAAARVGEFRARCRRVAGAVAGRSRWRVAGTYRRRLPGAAAGRYRRRVAVGLAVLLLALTGVPAVRAAVADWFGFAGVRVRLDREGAPPPSATPAPPPSVTSGLTLGEARALVSFTPLLPAALGPPDGVAVSADRTVLSMSWDGAAGAGPVRLDQFAGGLDFVFAKTARDAEYTVVAGEMALWFDQPHAVSWLSGTASRTEPPRLAGHTLIWQRGGTALRLEGDVTLDGARRIAESARNL
jgi:hypothetical protein